MTGERGRVKEKLQEPSGDTPLPIIGLRELVQSKRDAGRYKDLDDVEHLLALERSRAGLSVSVYGPESAELFFDLTSGTRLDRLAPSRPTPPLVDHALSIDDGKLLVTRLHDGATLKIALPRASSPPAETRAALASFLAP